MSKYIIELEPNELPLVQRALKRELMRNTDQEETATLVNLISYIEEETA